MLRMVIKERIALRALVLEASVLVLVLRSARRRLTLCRCPPWP